MPRMRSTLRNHLHFIAVVSILLVAMTWPTMAHVFDASVFWLPIDSGDIWIKFWDAWYGKLIISGQAEFYFTDLSFYPDGLSLAYHIFTIPHMIIFGSLQLFMPASNAYNLTYLFIILSTALSAYTYLLYLIKDKWVSLFGAVIFGFSGYIVGRPPHPGETFLITLPLALYFFHRALLEKRWLFIGISGILIGATAFIGIYAFVCLLMTLGAYILYFTISRWRNRHFWLMTVLLLAIIGSISIIRIYPMLDKTQDLEGILDKRGGQEQENDLLQYFINYENPIVNRLITNRITTNIIKLANPGRWNSAYLGYVPLILIGLGIVRATYRRQMLAWLMLILPFLVLRLGSVLTINNQQTGIFLPKHYLDAAFPAIFEGFYAPDHFQIGVILPLAILSCYGLMAFLESVSAKHRSRIILLLVALVALEYYRPPEGKMMTDEQTEFLDWFAELDNQDSIRLINLPMNRGNSKLYLFYQTLGGYPQVEGLATRTPPAAYSYIEGNLLLATWREKQSIQCSPENREDYLSALSRLLDDGLSHIVLHHSRSDADSVAQSFLVIEPSYEDEFTAIYELAALRDSCPQISHSQQ